MPGRPAAGAEGPLRLPEAEALGGRRLPIPGRAVAGVRQAGGRPARRVDPGPSGATSTSTAGSPASRCASSGRCGSWSSTTTSCPATSTAIRAGSRVEAGPDRHLPSGWRARGTSFVHDPTSRAPRPSRRTGSIYRHWDPDRGRSEPVRDFNVYNGGDLRGENPRGRPDARGARRRRARRPGRPGPAPFGRRPIRGLAPGRRPGRCWRSAATGSRSRSTGLGGMLASSPRRVAPLRDAGGVGRSIAG